MLISFVWLYMFKYDVCAQPYARKYWKKPRMADEHGACCGIQNARQDTVPRSLVGVGA